MVYINSSPCIHVYNGYILEGEKRYEFELNIGDEIFIKWGSNAYEIKEVLEDREREIMLKAKSFI